MVSREGFNALLKLVEEPPEHVKFVFATTEPDKVIATIRSRTHHYPFRLVPPRELHSHLARLCEQEKVEVDPTVLSLVVRAGRGSVRDSMCVLDQLLAGAGSEGLTYAAGRRAARLHRRQPARRHRRRVRRRGRRRRLPHRRPGGRGRPRPPPLRRGPPRAAARPDRPRRRPRRRGQHPRRAPGRRARADAPSGGPLRCRPALPGRRRGQRRTDRDARRDRTPPAARADLRPRAAACGRRRPARAGRPPGPARAPRSDPACRGPSPRAGRRTIPGHCTGPGAD